MLLLLLATKVMLIPREAARKVKTVPRMSRLLLLLRHRRVVIFKLLPILNRRRSNPEPHQLLQSPRGRLERVWPRKLTLQKSLRRRYHRQLFHYQDQRKYQLTVPGGIVMSKLTLQLMAQILSYD